MLPQYCFFNGVDIFSKIDFSIRAGIILKMNYDYTLTWGPTPSGGCATLKYFDDDYETELWEVKGTKYLYNIEDSIAYNRKGEYMGD